MNKEDFKDLLTGIKEIGKIREGKIKPGRVFKFNPMEVKNIRKKLKQSQKEFSFMIGVSIGTLKNWEQGRRVPEGPARALLKVASKKPQAVLEALHN
ncbi:hypothetical protein MNBD_UNCLBAC01-1400 [hydrothermal vent metagenome]|uniref:HTH cro/C1-type domain-containing protein n=1 Tax=hydrothermal vent metagenome TaxID=652676 RepID=A0A3B1CZV0_9ZZZZ